MADATATGAGIGSLVGPIGTAIGAGMGALFGGITSWQQSEIERKAAAEREKARKKALDFNVKSKDLALSNDKGDLNTLLAAYRSSGNNKNVAAGAKQSYDTRVGISRQQQNSYNDIITKLIASKEYVPPKSSSTSNAALGAFSGGMGLLGNINDINTADRLSYGGRDLTTDQQKNINNNWWNG
jgi:hypothetical protein